MPAEALWLIEAGPDCCHQIRVVAGEPAVDRVVGGAGLAGEVVAAERQRTPPVPRVITSCSMLVMM